MLNSVCTQHLVISVSDYNVGVGKDKTKCNLSFLVLQVRSSFTKIKLFKFILICLFFCKKKREKSELFIKV